MLTQLEDLSKAIKQNKGMKALETRLENINYVWKMCNCKAGLNLHIIHRLCSLGVMALYKYVYDYDSKCN